MERYLFLGRVIDTLAQLKDVSAFVPADKGTDFLAGTLFVARGLVRAVAALTGGYLASELFLVVGKIGEKPPGVLATKE